MNRVILDPVTPQRYKDDGKEPQYVTFQYQNQGEIYLDSQTSIDKIGPANMILSTRKTTDSQQNLLFTNISRVSVQSIGFNFISPNVNPRNNRIVVFSSFSGSFHQVDLIEGFYNTTDLLIDHIVTRLNTITGLTGLTFSRVAVPLMPGAYTLSSAGGNYYFNLDCSAMVKGYQLYNLPRDQTPTSSKIVGVMSLIYTRYIDFVSSQLTKYAKVPSRTTGYSNNIIERMYIDDSTYPHVVAQYEPGSSIFNYKPTDSVSSIDIKLLDQFGDELYVPQWNGTDAGFYFDVNITVF